MAIKGVISDFGNVVLNFDNMKACKDFAKISPHSAEGIHKIIFEDELDIPYHKGFDTSEEFYEKVKKNIKIDVSYDKFKEIWGSIFFFSEENKKIIDLLKNVKKKNNIKLAMLSNNNEIHFEESEPKFLNLDYFDVLTSSYKIKSIKPEKKIYLTTVKRLKLKPEECIYIDDIKDYVKAANKLGLKGIHCNAQYKGAASKLKQDLARFGLKV